MAEDRLASLQAIDLAILTEVVRQDQRDPSFEITEWSVRRLSDKGLVNPDGLWLISGHGRVGDTTRSWSVVVKILERPDQETPPDARHYWKRELLMAQSGLLDRLRGAVRAPRFYRVDEYDDCGWLWMEHVVDRRSDTWTLNDYAIAAHQLGRWNGTSLTRPLPTEPWLAKQHYHAWVGIVHPEEDWRSPLHKKHISEDTRLRFERLWADRELFYRILEGLPQCFVHFDCQRRNLFFQQGTDDQDDLVIIDWAMCSVGALGTELQALVGGSASFMEWPSSALAALDTAAFTSYVQGLRETGWSGDEALVRLGYVTWLAIYRGAILPYAMTNYCTPENRERSMQQFGIAEEELYVRWLTLFHYWLDCADEARALMKRTGMM